VIADSPLLTSGDTLYSYTIGHSDGLTVKSGWMYGSALSSVIVYTWSTKTGFTREVGGSQGSTRVSSKDSVLYSLSVDLVAVPLIVIT
jgi:hypothetical protein